MLKCQNTIEIDDEKRNSNDKQTFTKHTTKQNDKRK